MREPHSWLRQYGAGYRFLARSERRAISDFVLLWSLFEAQVNRRNASISSCMEATDRWVAAGVVEWEPLVEAWDHFRARLTDEGELNHHFQSLRIHSAAVAGLVGGTLLNPDAGEGDRIKALLIIIYRLRNNLLHGEKWSYGLADQELNFRHASHVLMHAMEFDQLAPDPEAHHTA